MLQQNARTFWVKTVLNPAHFISIPWRNCVYEIWQSLQEHAFINQSPFQVKDTHI
jgi:hypothetical protein